MKNKIILLLSLFATFNFLLAQNSREVTIVEKNIKLGKLPLDKAFYSNSTDIILSSFFKNSQHTKSKISKKYNYFNLIKINEDLDLIDRKKISNNMFGKRMNIENIIKFGEKGWLFFSYSNIETKKNYLFAQKFDFINLELEDEPIKIAEVKYYKNNRELYGNYIFKLSANKKYLMITNIPWYSEESVRRIYGIIKVKVKEKGGGPITTWVFNQNMEIINYLKNVKITGSSSKTVYLNTENMFISDNGNMYFVGLDKKIADRKMFSNKSDFQRTEKTEYTIALYDTSNKLYTYELKRKGLVITDLQIKVNEITGNFFIMGLYSKNRKGAHGIVCIELSKENLSEISYTKKPFSDDFILSANKRYDKNVNDNDSKKSKKKKKDDNDEKGEEEKDNKPKSKYLEKFNNNEYDTKEVKDTTINKTENDESNVKEDINNLSCIVDIEFDENNNPIGIFEKQWLVITTTTTSSNGKTTTSTTYTYYYGDIVLIKIENNDISQTKILRKLGKVSNFQNPTGTSIVSNDKKIIFYYDNHTVEFNKEDLSTKYKNPNNIFKLAYPNYEVRFRLNNKKSLSIKSKIGKNSKVVLLKTD